MLRDHWLGECTAKAQMKVGVVLNEGMSERMDGENERKKVRNLRKMLLTAFSTLSSSPPPSTADMPQMQAAEARGRPD